MNARRLFKLFVSRSWLIVIVALVGAATAYFVTSSQNSQIEATWEATAPVLILKTSAESDTDYDSRLRLAESRARLAVEFELADNPGTYRVGASAERGRLEFIATGGDPDTAENLAEGLRATYLTAEPTDGIVEQLTANMHDLEVKILALRSNRDTLAAGTPVDPGVASKLALMQDQLSSLRRRAAALSLAIRFPELGTALDEDGAPLSAADVRTKLATVEGTIVRLQAEYDRLAATSPGAEGPDGSVSLEILVIDQKVRDLESQYIDTALTLEELSGGGTSSVVSNRTEIANVTPIPTSPASAGMLGLVLGAALAAVVVVATDRLRRRVLGIEDDLALPIIAIVDPARPGAGPGRPWYPDAVGRRRGDVQALRAALDGALAGGAVTIGLAGLGATDTAVQELAADLATCIAASGRVVLLADTVFDEPSDLPEYGGAGMTLADIVIRSTGSESVRDDLELAIGGRDRPTSGRLSLRAGRLDADPVDALAGRRFRELLDAATDVAEVVIVAAPHWGYLATDVLTQRLDHIVLVGRSGITTAPDLEDAVAELETRHAQPVGLVLLGRRSAFGIGVRRRSSGDERSTRRAVPAIAEPEPPAAGSGADHSEGIEVDDLPASDATSGDAPEVAVPSAGTPATDSASGA